MGIDDYGPGAWLGSNSTADPSGSKTAEAASQKPSSVHSVLNPTLGNFETGFNLLNSGKGLIDHKQIRTLRRQELVTGIGNVILHPAPSVQTDEVPHFERPARGHSK